MKNPLYAFLLPEICIIYGSTSMLSGRLFLAGELLISNKMNGGGCFFGWVQTYFYNPEAVAYLSLQGGNADPMPTEKTHTNKT